MYPQKAFLPFRRRCGDGWIWYIKATVCIQKPDGPALNLNFQKKMELRTNLRQLHFIQLYL